MNSNKNADEVRRQVRTAYADSARTVLEEGRKNSVRCGSGSSCCGASAGGLPVEQSPSGQIYGAEALADLPADVAGASWGCGDPVSLAGLRTGDVVVDLGSGGGLDCLLAGRRVGPTGRVIGVDMTPEMLSLAWRNVAKAGATNVEFRYGTIENMPVESSTVDWVISNCVINLSPDKPAVFRDIARILKPGGRVSVSDVVLLGEISADMRADVDLYAACVSGALREDDYLAAMRAAGLSDVTVASRVVIDPHDYTEDSEKAKKIEGLIASVRVTATKAS
jgi:arsenite methyltransferase